MIPDDLPPSAFDGCVRLYQTTRPRDVQPGRVPLQILASKGRVCRELELTETIMVNVERLAAREGYTLEQMVARIIFELLPPELGGAS